jgi:phospholipase C
MTPAELRARIDTVVIVMMENRSFDHVLGHLRLPQFGNRSDVMGLDDLENPDFANASHNGRGFQPALVRDDNPLATDLPHERSFVATQLARAANGQCMMNGFVLAHEDFLKSTGVLDPPPLRVLTPDRIPVTSFFADGYMICDRWHAPLPASTQPNRLFAISGYSVHDVTISGLLPDQDTVFDWLERRTPPINWRVYSAGLSFFVLMPKMWKHVISGRFRPLGLLAHDAQTEAPGDFPQVILVEPDYDDAPVHLSGHANDNHPPLPVGYGEVFLKNVYDALSTSRHWAKTLAIVTYDEHGGFFDHVAPLQVPSAPPPGATFTAGFDSTGPRVPALLLSPYAPARSVTHATLDHTSILQLIADRFDPSGAPYSTATQARAVHGIASLTSVLSVTPRADVPPCNVGPIPAGATMLSTQRPPASMTPGQTAFAVAAEAFAKDRDTGQAGLQKYPDLAHWLATKGS